jgi:general secretion pathway protein D
MNLRLCAAFFLFLCVTSCAPKQTVKQVEQPVILPAAEELKLPDVERKKEVKEEKTPIPEVVKKSEEQYVMLNFENADIETVISTVSEMLKINYILAPGVTGKITIQSHNKVPLSELFSTFQTMLEFNGFTAVKDGSFYRIVPIDTAKQQPVKVNTGKDVEMPQDASFVTQQFPLDYVKANDVANIVRNLMPRGTDIVVYEPTNMLVVTAPPSGMVKFMKLLEAIDIPSSERDSIRTYVYYVENGEAKKLADILKSLYAKQQAGAGAPVKSVAPTTPPAPSPLRRPAAALPTPQAGATVQEGIAGVVEGDVVIDAYEDINALIIKSTPRAYLTLLETIKRLDTQPKQVLIEVLIAEVTLKNETKFGIEWLAKRNIHVFGDDYLALFGNTQGGVKGTQLPSGDDFVTTLPTGAFGAFLDPQNLAMLISASATNNDLNVLASPHVLALDNREAKIEIANEVPVATSISQPQDVTQNIYSQVQFKSAGVILSVTPHVNEKKQVTLKINQEVSELGEKVPIAGQDYQGFITRKAITSAIVQDGHTLIIGGIISENKRKDRVGIPFLSEIPVLGYLFGSTTDSTERRELILMVTPHVVATHDEADLLTREYESRIKAVKRKIEEMQKKLGREGGGEQSDIHLHDDADSREK